ncbi:DUF4935 domain-containing protein [Ideonella sp. B7]|uniref:PIN domain-containing protein n=1 Tax=Ideonella benzenivorans TaxID=2831643 RepID=UPI001CED91B1|nr:PIN domain-containing protein [Ideonella benzenivorans]MCA6215519.1 DUF4935 domain-containing protein [Ideonella benzenivorans]
MKFFLDTNVFYGDWFLRNANFRYLFHFINNEGHELLVSRAVMQEAENIRNRDLHAAVSEVKKHLLSAAKLNGQPVATPEPTFCIEPYDLLEALRLKLDSVALVEYQSISHAVVVERALKRVRPFQENEKGYRDTLIWLSLLEHLSRLPAGSEIVFISANKSDFYDPSSKTPAFHPSLQEDIDRLCPSVVIRPYLSLFDFVDKTIDKSEHALDHSRAEMSFGEYVEEQGVNFLESIQPQVISKLQSLLTPGAPALSNATSLSADVTEGIEDLDILSTSEVGGADVYVSCMYNLRRVEIKISIPESDYLVHRQKIEGSGWFYERDTDGTQVQLTTMIRPYFTASFVHNVNDLSSRDFTVDDFSVR